VEQLIAAYREDRMELTKNFGTTSLFSLKKQTIVAEVQSSVTYMDARSGRPVDIRTLGEGWPKLYDGLTKKAEHALELRKEWDSEILKRSKSAKTSKI
jgi:hypothetical protein